MPKLLVYCLLLFFFFGRYDHAGSDLSDSPLLLTSYLSITYFIPANAKLDANQCYYVERCGIETRYAKVLRAFFVHQKSEGKPYQSINLSTRLFTPVQTEWTKHFESVSKTFQRTIKWLAHTRK